MIHNEKYERNTALQLVLKGYLQILKQKSAAPQNLLTWLYGGPFIKSVSYSPNHFCKIFDPVPQ